MGYRHADAGDDALRAAQQRIRSLGGVFRNMADGLLTAISNALLVSADHTASGHPIAVFGQQTSYFEPQLLLEMAVNGAIFIPVA